VPPTGNFHEDRLHHVFRFSRIANDLKSDAQDKAVVAAKQNRKSVIAAILQVRHQLLIVQTL
jgi:hypothetical protein